jgi:hypothetical protein
MQATTKLARAWLYTLKKNYKSNFTSPILQALLAQPQSKCLLLFYLRSVYTNNEIMPHEATKLEAILPIGVSLVARRDFVVRCKYPLTLWVFLVSDPLCLSSSLALRFSEYSFWVHHLVNQDDWQLLAHAMASDFSVAWQCLSKITIGFLLWIKLHALWHNSYQPIPRGDSTSRPSTPILSAAIDDNIRPRCKGGTRVVLGKRPKLT